MRTEHLHLPHRSQAPMESNRRTFWLGFLRGLSAPAMLFSSYRAPEIRPYTMTPLYRPAKSDLESLRNDMMRIGGDIRRAMQKYDEE